MKEVQTVESVSSANGELRLVLSDAGFDETELEEALLITGDKVPDNEPTDAVPIKELFTDILPKLSLDLESSNESSLWEVTDE